MRHLANILTALNLVFGFTAVLLSIDGHFELAAWFIILAVVMDAFDGKAARFFGASSQMGVQFDSMADLVSMGVAPSVLCYSAAFREDSMIGMVICTIPVLAAAFRLARFNLRARSSSGLYEGLTSPLHACLVATFILMNYSIWERIVSVEILAGLVFVTSLLMVSRVPLGGLPRFTFREHGRNSKRLLILAACVGAALVKPALLGFPAMLILIISAAIAGQLQIRRTATETDDEELPEPLTSTWKNH